MTVLGANVLTLGDWAKRLDPNGKVPLIVEMLSQTNDVLADMLWKEGNTETGDRTTIRTGLPTVGWRLLNNGAQPSKSTTAQVDFSCGIMEAWSEVDVKLANIGGNAASFRLSEAAAFIEAMNQEMASTIFYGNSKVDPEEFSGLSVQYSDPSATNGSNVIDAGASGSDNTSIWLIGWGANSIYGVFPRGSKAGLEHNDLGETTVQTSATMGGTRLRVYQDQFVWNAGLAIRDWRFAVRIGSIDVSDTTGKTSAPDLIELMIKAIHRLPTLSGIRPAFYMNRTMLEMLDIQKRDDVISGGGLTTQNVDGIPVQTLRGIPVRKCDAILETEDKV